MLFAQQVVETLAGGPQPDAVLARQMQALSLAVHIPIVCFGIAFPAMFLFVHGLYLRTGNPVYKALAKRWSKVALVIFAVGVVPAADVERRTRGRRTEALEGRQLDRLVLGHVARRAHPARLLRRRLPGAGRVR